MDRVLQSQEADVYGLRGKLPDPTACPDCGSTARAAGSGRRARDAHSTACPACRRIADDYPAGIVTLSGSFHVAHREEIEGLVRHVEEREKKEHALKRVMAIREDGDDLVITTTNAHLARGIGEAIHHAYQGELDYVFTERENVLRVQWRR
jgi:hypothetical protein